MLTADRQQQTDRAVRSFLTQTYRPSLLLIYDTGKVAYKVERLATSRIIHVYDGPEMSGPIGALRNRANSLTIPMSEILIHFDSDDWSGPHRIADQVASLQESGRDCVGYRSVLFWRRYPLVKASPEVLDGQAWAYHNTLKTYCIGASLCYWRTVWERKKFQETLPGPNRGMGEDREWLRHVDSAGFVNVHIDGPHLVCEIHGGNTMSYDLEAQQERGDTFWKRAPEFDSKLTEIMKL